MSLLQAENYWKVKHHTERLIRERFPLLSLRISLSFNSQWKFFNEFNPCTPNRCVSHLKESWTRVFLIRYFLLFLSQLFYLEDMGSDEKPLVCPDFYHLLLGILDKTEARRTTESSVSSIRLVASKMFSHLVGSHRLPLHSCKSHVLYLCHPRLLENSAVPPIGQDFRGLSQAPYTDIYFAPTLNCMQETSRSLLSRAPAYEQGHRYSLSPDSSIYDLAILPIHPSFNSRLLTLSIQANDWTSYFTVKNRD